MIARRTYNLSLFRLGIPLVVNELSTRDGQGSPELTEPLSLNVPQLGQQFPINTGTRDLETLLQDLDRPVRADILAGHPDPGPRRLFASTYLLPSSSWPHDGEARRSIVSHIDPTDPSIPDFWRADHRRNQDLLADFQNCVQVFNPTYRKPEKQKLPNGATVQNIPTPGETASAQQGTCLDFAILLAAIHEAGEGAPLLVFSGHRDGSPDHALIAAWTPANHRQTEPDTDPAHADLLDSKRIRAAVAAGQLVVLESTEIAEGHSRSADEAADRGRRFVEAHECHALDVAAVRRGANGRATPGLLAFDPVVSAAALLATQIAREDGRGQRESSHLLRALAEMRSPLLLETFGSEVAARLSSNPSTSNLSLSTHLAHHSQHSAGVATPNPTATLKTTEGYAAALLIAKSYARREANHRVQELHLLRSLLERPRLGISRAIRTAGGSPEQGLATLIALHKFEPGPSPSSGFDTTHF